MHEQPETILIAQVEPPEQMDTGDYFYRTHAPGKAMAIEDGVFFISLTNVHRIREQVMQDADILILVNLCDPDLLPLIRHRQEQKKLTVFEIADDLGAIQPWNPVNRFYQNRENLALVYRLAGSCDALQVSVPELKKIYGSLNRHCAVFPNQVYHVPPERPLRERDKTIIGWGGSHGHLEDMAEIADPLIEWIRHRTDVSLHLMCSEPIRDLFEDLPMERKKWVRTGTMDEYYNFLSRIHIGIAPLKNTAFNRSRSDVKFLEYAASGVVPVMASLEPYLESVKHGETGFLFEDPHDLIAILQDLVESPSRAHEIARASRDYVIRERQQMNHGRDRVDYYKSLCMKFHGPGWESGEGHRNFYQWAEVEGAEAEGRYLRLTPTPFEKLLHRGLIDMQDNSARDRAHRHFQEAAHLEPGNYLPPLFDSLVSPDPIETLEKGYKQKPDSIKTLLLLGEAYAGKGQLREAFASFEAAVNLCPDYEIPYLRAGELLMKIGEQSQADTLFQKVKDLDKYHMLIDQHD